MDAKPGMKRLESKKEMSLDKSQLNYIEHLQRVKKLKSETKVPPVEKRKKARSPVSVINFSALPSFANFSCVG